MAIYHLSVSNVSRAGGASSCASLAYISGEEVTDERTGKTYDYSRKERILTTGTILPDSAPPEYADPKKLFNAVEKFEESKTARTAKKIELALPHELNLDGQKKLLEDFIRTNLTSRGYCATYAIHDQNYEETDEAGEHKKITGNKNIHVHILIANRPLDKNGNWSRKRKTVFKLDENGNKIPAYEYERDERGRAIRDEAGEKILRLDENGQPIQRRDGKGTLQWERENIEQNPLDTKKFLESLRKNWADAINRCPEVLIPVDHRSHEARGLETAPTIHEGYAAREFEKRGGVSERCQYNRDVRAANSELEAAQFEINVLELDLADTRDRIDRMKHGVQGIGGKLSGAVGAVANEVKGQVKGGLDAIKGGKADERSGGLVKAFADTLNDGINSAINKSPVGVAVAPFKAPLHVLKNVDCKEVEQMKAEEAAKKSKRKKAKAKANDNDEKSPGMSRSRGR